MKRDPARSAARAAEQLQHWLEEHGSGSRPLARGGGSNSAQGQRTTGRQPEAGLEPFAAPVRAQHIAPAHTDWLYHHLTVTGPADQVAGFRSAAAGAGVIPWRLDLDRMEEDVFLRLAAPPAGQNRTLSLEGARMLASELREAVGRRHALAVAAVGSSRACPFDLHALLPVPANVLLLGPDHSDAIAWLWTHWGTTEALRHVVRRQSSVASGQEFRLSFWAADWTPWRAFETMRATWPGLRFDVRPVYETT